MKNHEVLDKIILTEESYGLVQSCDTFVFRVARDKNKIEIRKAVEDSFGVKVVSVNTSITSSRSKSIRGQVGAKARVRGYKKAFVKIKKEDVSKIPLI